LGHIAIAPHPQMRRVQSFNLFVSNAVAIGYPIAPKPQVPLETNQIA
jgi:hypothetical protein